MVSHHSRSTQVVDHSLYISHLAVQATLIYNSLASLALITVSHHSTFFVHSSALCMLHLRPSFYMFHGIYITSLAFHHTSFIPWVTPIISCVTLRYTPICNGVAPRANHAKIFPLVTPIRYCNSLAC